MMQAIINTLSFEHYPHQIIVKPYTTQFFWLSCFPQTNRKKQGSHYFLNLYSGKHVTRNNWTVLPMPAEVIATIHQLAPECNKTK